MTFPDFDFKTDRGDDPKVRQWLHENGFRLSIFKRSVLVDLSDDQKYLCAEVRHNRIFTYDPDDLGFISERAKLINPYDYMQQPEPTVKQSLTVEQEQDHGTVEPLPEPEPTLTIPASCLAEPASHMMMLGKDRNSEIKELRSVLALAVEALEWAWGGEPLTSMEYEAIRKGKALLSNKPEETEK